MKTRLRLIFAFVITCVLTGWYGVGLYAEEHAKPRKHGGQNHDKSDRQKPQSSQDKPHDRGGEHAKVERRRDTPPSQAQPRATREPERAQPQDRARRNDNRADAQRRHPRPDGNYDRYNWRNYSQRQRWDRDRFPRHYSGPQMFQGRYYRGQPFGPHYRLRYLYRNIWQFFYWPYSFAPRYECGWYWVPTDRVLAYDPYSREEYWEYTNYEHVYLCFD